MQSRFGLAVALAVAGVLAGTLTSTASVSERSPSEADVSTTAQQMGRSTQEVTSYADGQGTFAQVVSDLSSAHPDGFVDAVWDGPDSRATLIEVHRSILSEARRAAGNQARYVVASDRPSAERRAQIEHEVVEQAATLIEGRHDVSAEVSPGAETVTIVLGGFDAASTADAGARAATAQHLLEGITLPAGVKHVQVTTSSATSGPEFGSGGTWRGTFCTAGLTAARSGRVATGTAHCGSTSSHDGATLSGS